MRDHRAIIEYTATVAAISAGIVTAVWGLVALARLAL